MNRLIAYTVVAVAITIPAVLLARTLIDSQEDQLDRIIDGIEEERVDAFLESGAFDSSGLVVSSGAGAQRFGAGEQEHARAALEQATGIDGASSVRIRQRQVTLRETRATAILNIEVDDGDYVALRLDLGRHEEEWRVERVRVMG